MDQPTKFEITITGNIEDVKGAALLAQKRLDNYADDLDDTCALDDDFESKLADAIGIMGDFDFTENEDGTAKYSTEQDNYDCVEQDDIEDIANDIVEEFPDVEFHISAVITITYEEGYDLCVDIDYADGEMSVDTSEDPYEDWDDEEDEDEEEDDE